MNNRFVKIVSPLLILSATNIVSHAVFAGEALGYIGAEALAFLEDPLFPRQSDASISLTSQLEYFHDFDDSNQRFAITLFGRADSQDDERTHADIRELYWWRNFDSFEAYAGIRKVFWGVTESAHLVDIINQDDSLESVDREEKLGQPMLQLIKVSDWGTWELFSLFGFREQAFPGEQGRLRAGLPIDEDAIYESSDEREHIDFAARWSHYFDVVDIAVSYFTGTSRDPIFLPQYSGGVPTSLLPFYNQIDRVGLTTQITLGSWLAKLEATTTRERFAQTSQAAVVGFEYTLFGIGGGESDLGLLMEYQYDDLKGPRQVLSQNDVVGGIRWALNDIDGSQLLFLASHDLDYNHQFYSLEYSRRIFENWKFELEAAAFTADNPTSLDFSLRSDDYLRFEFKRYF